MDIYYQKCNVKIILLIKAIYLYMIYLSIQLYTSSQSNNDKNFYYYKYSIKSNYIEQNTLINLNNV